MSYTVDELDAAVEGGLWIVRVDNPEYADLDLDDYIAEYHGSSCDYWDVLAETVYYHPRYDKDVPSVTLPGIGVVTQQKRFGGEGKGDEYWVVVKVVGEDGSERLFKRNGWYASFDGGHYEGPTEEVEQAEKTVTYYKAV